MIEIAHDVVDVWETPLAISDVEVAELFELLTSVEQSRSRGFVDDRGYRQYVISRAQMRKVLSSYTGTPARDIDFMVVGDGKPALRNQSESGIFFNNTHSGELGLIAVTIGREVGVDMEKVRQLERALQLSKRFFAPDEHESLTALPAEEMIREFMRIWTRREAGTKARGASVWRGLGSWKGSRMARRPGVQANDATEFTTAMLDLGTEYIGAVVAAGTDWRVEMRGAVS